MNNLFTSKGRVIVFLLLIFQFGLKLQASAHIRMICDTDTTATKQAKNSQILKVDSAVILKAGSTIVKNADSILIINGIPTKVPVNSPAVKANPEATVSTDATGAANTTDAAGAANTTTITAPPVDGTIQVKDKTTAPINTTIVAPPTDGVIQVKDKSTMQADSSAKSKTDTALVKKSDTTLVKKPDTTLVKKPDTTARLKDTGDSTQVKAKGYFLEIGGPGLAISANYDSRFNKQRDGWGYRVGLGGFIAGGNNVVTVPFQINYLIGEHSSMFEVGAGTTFLSSRGDNKGKTWEFDKITGFVATGSIGYRYQPQHKGINFRLAFVPILYDEGIIPAGGISVGYTFK
ncbi:MAG: hypothetical protein JWP78_2427 [Mucilaginibacter sp.]|nr:hypothetical protein [Mucilaginibacter sp.]